MCCEYNDRIAVMTLRQQTRGEKGLDRNYFYNVYSSMYEETFGEKDRTNSSVIGEDGTMTAYVKIQDYIEKFVLNMKHLQVYILKSY